MPMRLSQDTGSLTIIHFPVERGPIRNIDSVCSGINVRGRDKF